MTEGELLRWSRDLWAPTTQNQDPNPQTQAPATEGEGVQPTRAQGESEVVQGHAGPSSERKAQGDPQDVIALTQRRCVDSDFSYV